MSRTIIGQLILRLRAEGLAEGQKVENRMHKIERAARRLSQAPAGNWGTRFQKQLDGLRAAPGEINAVRTSWERLHASMKRRNLNTALRSSEISHWKTQTISSLGQIRAAAGKEFGAIEKRARLHKSRLGKIFGGPFRSGMVMAGGYTGAYMGGMLGMEALSASSERRREIFRQRMASIPKGEQETIFQRSEELGQKYPSVPITAIMEMARTARNTMGDTERGLQVLEEMVKGFVTLQSAKGVGTAITELDGLIRGIDNLGKNSSGQLGIKNVRQIIDAMIRAAQIEGLQFDPGKFWQFARRSKIAGPALSTEFLGAVAPAFMQDLSPESFGKMLSSAYQSLVIGANSVASKKNLEEQRRIGIRQGEGKGELVGDDLFGSNPYAWVKQYLVPALKKDGVDLSNETAVSKSIANLARNTHATGLLSRMVTQQAQVDRLVGLYRESLGTGVAEDVRFEDPFVGWEAFKKSMENLSSALTPIDHINAGLNGLADGINRLSESAEKSPFSTAMMLGTAGIGTYAGGKWAVGKMSDMFGLKSSALALDGSAAALTRAAAALGGAGVVDGIPGGGKKPKGGGRSGLRSWLMLGAGGLGLLGLDWQQQARIETLKKQGMTLREAAQKVFEQNRGNSQSWNSWLDQKMFGSDHAMESALKAREDRYGRPPHSIASEESAAPPIPSPWDDYWKRQGKQAGKDIEDSLTFNAKGGLEVDDSAVDRARAKVRALKREVGELGNQLGMAERSVGSEMRRNFADTGGY